MAKRVLASLTQHFPRCISLLTYEYLLKEVPCYIEDREESGEEFHRLGDFSVPTPLKRTMPMGAARELQSGVFGETIWRAWVVWGAQGTVYFYKLGRRKSTKNKLTKERQTQKLEKEEKEEGVLTWIPQTPLEELPLPPFHYAIAPQILFTRERILCACFEWQRNGWSLHVYAGVLIKAVLHWKQICSFVETQDEAILWSSVLFQETSLWFVRCGNSGWYTGYKLVEIANLNTSSPVRYERNLGGDFISGKISSLSPGVSQEEFLCFVEFPGQTTIASLRFTEDREKEARLEEIISLPRIDSLGDVTSIEGVKSVEGRIQIYGEISGEARWRLEALGCDCNDTPNYFATLPDLIFDSGQRSGGGFRK